MLNDFNNIFQFSISFNELFESLLTAVICGFIISFFYRKTYNGPGYLNSFVNSLVVLPMITAIVILVIGNNLARAFGLVGAMSIIRFRTAVKETQDIIFIFFSLAIGMAAGVGYHLVAFTGSLFIGIISLILAKSNLASPHKKDLLLQFSLNGDGNLENEVDDLINKHCKRKKLINAKSIGENGKMEYSYHIGIKNKDRSTEFLKELKQLDGIKQVNLYFDEEYF